MVCEVIAFPDVEKAAEVHSPSDIASSARVHVTKVCCVIYAYFWVYIFLWLFTIVVFVESAFG